MTIIAVRDGVMAADSAAFQGDLMFPAPEPKILRLPHGGLIGASGATGDCQILRGWAADGMDFKKPPRFSFANPGEDHSILWLWLHVDRSVWMGDCTMNVWRVPDPIIVGYGSQYAYGLLDGGADLYTAVEMAIARSPWLGGPVQVERLEP